MDAGRAVRWCACAVLVWVTLLPGTAEAASVPMIGTGPAITGTPRVGALLTATATWRGDPTPTATWAWLRCARPTGACDVITGAAAATYRPTSADTGKVLRVRLRVTNTEGTAEKRSDPTAVVAAAPPPTPTPTATPAPTPPVPTATPSATAAPSATATPVATAPPTVVAPAAAPAPAATVAPAAAPPPRLTPFPVVRVKGVLTDAGARVTLLSVRAPQGSRVRVRCRGAGCPVRTYTASTATGRLRPFERALRAGTRLEIRVTKAGYVGKSTLIVIRRQAEPKRTDRCLPPGAKRAVRCPAA